MHPLQPSESRLLAAVAGVLLIAVFGPPVAQVADYHAFADAHTRWGVPHAFDVLSNLPFALVGLAGAWRLWRSGDALVWQLTGELVSGHTLKHLVAAAAAWPLVDALGRLQRRGQNPSALPRQAA